MDGIVNVYKEQGFTSHDVVAKLRGILRQRKIGHTGTLDPDAEGVLPVCLGNATKVVPFLMDYGKAYRTILLLGISTDTQDVSGEVLKESPVLCDEEEVRQCVSAFIGVQQQIPPMYSALKVNGRKLYELARQGIEVERTPRTITIDQITIDRIELPFVEMTVHCSKGTYIRTLCNDIGEALGCGGCMQKLQRTQVGSFDISESHRLSEIEKFRDGGRLEEIILPLDSVFSHLEAVRLTPEAEHLVRNGNPLSPEMMQRSRIEAASIESNGFHLIGTAGMPDIESPRRVYGSSGDFLAIYGYSAQKDLWRPVKMFLS